MTVLAVDVAVVRERHCAAAVTFTQRRRRLCTAAACLKASDAHFE